jgi:hypothetical protein
VNSFVPLYLVVSREICKGKAQSSLLWLWATRGMGNRPRDSQRKRDGNSGRWRMLPLLSCIVMHCCTFYVVDYQSETGEYILPVGLHPVGFENTDSGNYALAYSDTQPDMPDAQPHWCSRRTRLALHYRQSGFIECLAQGHSQRGWHGRLNIFPLFSSEIRPPFNNSCSTGYQCRAPVFRPLARIQLGLLWWCGVLILCIVL